MLLYATFKLLFNVHVHVKNIYHSITSLNMGAI